VNVVRLDVTFFWHVQRAQCRTGPCRRLPQSMQGDTTPSSLRSERIEPSAAHSDGGAVRRAQAMATCLEDGACSFFLAMLISRTPSSYFALIGPSMLALSGMRRLRLRKELTRSARWKIPASSSSSCSH